MAKKILVIDEDTEVSDLITETLRSRGYEVTATAVPAEGIAKAKEIIPDLIFISLFLPESNGLKLSKAIHGVSALSITPVVMLITHPGELDPKYTSAIGVVDVMAKPFGAADIVAKTEKILGKAAAPALEEILPIEEEEEELLPSEKTGRPARERESFKGAMQKELKASPQAEEDWFAAPPDTAQRKESGGSSAETDDYLDYAMDEDEHTPAAAPAGQGERAAAGAEASHDVLEEDILPAKKKGTNKVLLAAAAVVVVAVAVFGGLYARKLLFPSSQEVARKPSAPPAKQEPVQVKDNMPEKGVKETVAAQPMESATAQNEQQSKVEKKAQTARQKAEKAAPAAPDAARSPAPAREISVAASRPKVSVQVGVFVDEKNASALVDRLKKKGFDAFILRDEAVKNLKAGKAAHRVLVGRFEDRRKAAVQATALEKDGFKSIIFAP